MSYMPLIATVFTVTPLVLADAPAASEAAVTFSRDVAPIFQRRCQACHRDGEMAPMPLISYADARPYARSIKKKVEGGEMPPWHADPAYGKFQNDPRLPEEEIRTVSSWVEAGAPEGDPAHLPPPPEFVNGWRIGRPDVVFTIPQEFQVPAEEDTPKKGVPYQHFAVPTNFEQDRWVQAAEARAGNPEVVHHILVFIKEPDNKWRTREGDDERMWRLHLCGTAVGTEADVFPPGTAKLIKAGSYLIFQVHYTPKGKATTDRSSVGLIFAREPVKHRLRTQAVRSHRLRIPPGEPNHAVEARHTFTDDTIVWAMLPHMHLRGKSFRYDLFRPDGSSETLLSVPRWDFNWQHNYRLAEPLRLSAGSSIVCRAVYDNSAANRANPDPSKEVRWGEQTWQEMMIGFVTFSSKAEDRVERAF